jgi:hypothetical protein
MDQLRFSAQQGWLDAPHYSKPATNRKVHPGSSAAEEDLDRSNHPELDD